LKSYAYGYDNAGNRTVEAIDSTVVSASYNSVNERLQQQVGGGLRFAGTVNEPATITIGGAPGQVSASNSFEGVTSVSTGTNTVAVVATDPSGNVRTNTYEVAVAGTAKTFTHDANGNLTSDGTRTFEWDAEDRLVAVVQGTRRSEFTYNGLGQRVRIVEMDGAAVLTDRWYVWCELSICEERDSSGSSVLRRFFHHGVQEGTDAYLYTRDHLGSIREVTDATGTLRARYDYDPYGRQTKLSGDKEAAFGFTGHFRHSPSGLELAPFRAYDSSIGRWLREDPIGFSTADLNLYSYVSNDPVDFTDPTGEIAFVGVLFTPPGLAAMTAAGKAVLFVTSAAIVGIGLAEMTAQKDPPKALPPSTPVTKDPPTTPPVPPATPPTPPTAPPVPPPAPPATPPTAPPAPPLTPPAPPPTVPYVEVPSEPFCPPWRPPEDCERGYELMRLVCASMKSPVKKWSCYIMAFAGYVACRSDPNNW
jgi:RHS repeat-associated protein